MSALKPERGRLRLIKGSASIARVLKKSSVDRCCEREQGATRAANQGFQGPSQANPLALSTDPTIIYLDFIVYFAYGTNVDDAWIPLMNMDIGP
ncbi:hypothetical protein QC761_0109040 [Podospora bellae-mahoneyi]|uniref:Uncharacterized protein n=1 Tax=Podospora bellae-mahoneyi TaxID=2093777 RepID=A0ABR0F9V9_9PEZI|nr:hypothetical protein QC761_0109040 [Podospora bellae-mahoneyi]